MALLQWSQILPQPWHSKFTTSFSFLHHGDCHHNTLPFLELNIIKTGNKHEISVYKKSTNIDLLLHYHSHVDQRSAERYEIVLINYFQSGYRFYLQRRKFSLTGARFKSPYFHSSTTLPSLSTPSSARYYQPHDHKQPHWQNGSARLPIDQRPKVWRWKERKASKP